MWGGVNYIKDGIMTQPVPTIAHMLGEMVWVCSQSPIYKNLKISDIEWLLMPAILLEQYRVFHHEKTPIGFALWAFLSEEVEKRMNDDMEQGKRIMLTPQEWKSGERLWLMEMIVPTANEQNKLTHILMADLIKNVFKDKPFKFHQIHMEGGKRKNVTIKSSDFGDKTMTMQ